MRIKDNPREVCRINYFLFETLIVFFRFLFKYIFGSRVRDEKCTTLYKNADSLNYLEFDIGFLENHGLLECSRIFSKIYWKTCSNI